jgi:hypothetical protein
VVRLIVVVLGVGLVAGCASVPGSSSVDVLQRVTEGSGPQVPPGPEENASPVDLVQGFINSSAIGENQHAAARRFLTPDSQNWDDASSLTVLDNQLGLPSSAMPSSDSDHATVRLHGLQLGRLNPDGSFTPDETSVDLPYQVVKVNGQWRVDNPAPGAVVRFEDFRANYRSIQVYFTDPMRREPVADRRYVAANPRETLPSRVMARLLQGPSMALAGAAFNALPRTARLRSNVVPGPNGSVTVDLTELGDLDDARRKLIAEQVLLSMAAVNVVRVTLLDDGAPLIVGHQDLTQDSINTLDIDSPPSSDVPGLVVLGGRLHTMTTSEVGAPLGGPAGSGGYDLVAATMSPDGQRIAAVNRQAGRQLLIGSVGGALGPTSVRAAALTQPTWTADASEVWTVRDHTLVTRAILDQSGRVTVQAVDASGLASRGPINDLRLSRDGSRLAAVIGGQLVIGTVQRPAAGVVTIGGLRVLRPVDLTELNTVAWLSDDLLAVAGRKAAVVVGEVSVDGLDLFKLPWANLTPPVTSIAAAPDRPLLVTDQTGLWSHGMDEVGSWQRIGAGSATVAGYPG